MSKRLLVIYISFLFALASCNTSKHVSKIEEQTKAVNIASSSEKDSFSFEMMVDTAKECLHSLIKERIDFYPHVYIDSNGTTRQMVKAVEIIKKTDKINETKKEIKTIREVKLDTSSCFAEKEDSCKKSEKECKSKSNYYWLAIAILLLITLAIIRHKIAK